MDKPDPIVEAVATLRGWNPGSDTLVVAVWAEHHQALYRSLLRATRDAGVAEDLLQEAFLRYMRQVRSGRPPDDPPAWLHRVGANLVISRARRSRTALRGLVEIGRLVRRSEQRTPDAAVIARESSAELREALDSLGPHARLALIMASEGFRGPEIAAAIGRTEAATRTLMCRARRDVRTRLEGRRLDRDESSA